MISVNGRGNDLKEEISGYQELKLILSDMEKRRTKNVEIKYEILLRILHEMQTLKYQKNTLLDKNCALKRVEVSNQPKLDQGAQLLFLIIDILKDLKIRGAWIEYKNKTVHTKDYYRIEKDVLEKVIEEIAVGVDTKKILDTMANLGILRKQADKILSSATVDGAPKRIYMVRIDSVEYLSE